MATDKTEPPIARIVVIGALSIIALIGAQYALNSYFIAMYEREQHRVALDRPSEYLGQRRAIEDQQLRSGRSMPIEEAMSVIARGERPAAIEPRPSSEHEAMRGWVLMPRRFDPPTATPTEAPAAAPPAVAPASPAALDVPAGGP